MSRKAAVKPSAKRRLFLVCLTALVIFSLVIEVGSRIPGLGIPDWDTLFSAAGLRGTSATPAGQLEVHFIDVGNADCILVRQGEMAMLVDAGEKGDADTILNYLRQQGVERLNLVIATHFHADHIGSMAAVIRQMPVDTCLLSYMPASATPTSAVYLSMLEALDEQGVAVQETQPGDTFTLGDAQVQILGPTENTTDSNNHSIVTRVVFGEKRFLLMGDAETAAEEGLRERWMDLSADVLKAGHHGSNTGTDEAFLKRVSPQYAVLTCGAGNSYGHPHPETLSLLEAYGVETYRSDLCGHIVFTTDGKALSVSTQKEAA